MTILTANKVEVKKEKAAVREERIEVLIGFVLFCVCVFICAGFCMYQNGERTIRMREQ